MGLYLQTNSDGGKSPGYLNSGRKEGIGAIAQYQILLYAICKKLGVNFYNSGFKNIGHSSYTDYDEDDWSDSFTQFFNFSSDFDIEEKIHFSKIDEDLFSFIQENKNTSSKILIYIDPESVLDYGQLIINEIYEKKYLIDLKNRLNFNDTYFSNNVLNISFHIRNINLEDNCFQNFRELYNKNNFNYINIIEQLKKVCDEEVKLHIHSQGEQKDFEELLNYQQKKFEIELHINDHPISDIYHMSHADLLIMANSSFSWISHLMNYNITLVRDNFWHSTYPNTIKLDKDYSITKRLQVK